MATMLGWLRLAAAWASRRNRSTNDGSRAYSGKSALSATRRSSDSSRARYTSAIPPCAISRSIRYLFEKTWPTRDIVAKPYLPVVANSGCWTTGWCLRLVRMQGRLRPEAGREARRRDRRRDAPAGDFGVRAGLPTVLDEHRDRVLRCFGGRERDEPGGRVLVGAGFRGSGLARDGDACDLRGRAGAALHDLDHV